MPQSDYETVLFWQKETMDGADVLRLKGGMPIPKLADVRPQMKRLKIKASLNGAELAQIAKVLRASMSVQHFLKDCMPKNHAAGTT